MEHVLPEEFDSKILDSDKTTLVLFYADWCPYCANFKPTFDDAKSEKINKIVALVNEDENPLWDRFAIGMVPTIIAFQDGKILARLDAKCGIGLTRKDIESIIKELN